MSGTQAWTRGPLIGVVLGIVTCGPLHAADRFVSTRGSDAGNDCLGSASPCASIMHAVGQAASGDTIKVAQGLYREAVSLDASVALTLSGSWRPDFSAQAPEKSRSRIQSLSGPAVDVFTGVGPVTIDLTVDGFKVIGLPAVRVNAGLNGAATLVLRRCFLRHGFAGMQTGGQRVGVTLFASANGSLNVSLVDSIVRAQDGGVDAQVTETGVFRLELTRSTVRQSKGQGFHPFGIGLFSSLNAVTDLVLTDSVITNNDVGVSARVQNDSVLNIESTRSTLSLNRNGPAIDVLAGSSVPLTLTLTNSALLGNSAPAGGAMDIRTFSFAGSVSATLSNTTVSGNTAATEGGGILIDAPVGSVALDLVNTILWGNTAPLGGDLLVKGSGTATVNADHSDVGDVAMVSGTYNDLGGSIDADPLLLSRLNPHLRATSPAIDAGTCVGAPIDDIDGDPRPSGATCDIGADEFVP
jgi:hypothetical protein